MVVLAAFRGLRRQCPESRNQQVRTGARQFRSQGRQALRMSFGGTRLDRQVLALAMTELAQSLHHDRLVLAGNQREVADPV
jgi:hypothetical protein